MHYTNLRLLTKLLSLDLLRWKLAHRLLLAWGTFTLIAVFVRFAVFELGARTGQTDGLTDGQDPYCGLLERPHNTHYSS